MWTVGWKSGWLKDFTILRWMVEGIDVIFFTKWLERVKKACDERALELRGGKVECIARQQWRNFWTVQLAVWRYKVRPSIFSRRSFEEFNHSSSKHKHVVSKNVLLATGYSTMISWPNCLTKLCESINYKKVRQHKHTLTASHQWLKSCTSTYIYINFQFSWILIIHPTLYEFKRK